MLFDLHSDPDELDNLVGRPERAGVEAALHARIVQDWAPETIHQRILASQRRRPGSAGPTSVKARARFPYVEPVKPDR